MIWTRDEIDAAYRGGVSLSASLDALRWFNGMLDAACAAALAAGISLAEMWLEHSTSGVETRLMRGVYGPPAHGSTLARVWLDGLELRYEGIQLGAGWSARGGEA